jgi:signal transduction histidine kinase
MKTLIDHLIALPEFKDEITQRLAQFVLIIIYIGCLSAAGLFVFYALAGRWLNVLILAVLIVSAIYSYKLIHQGKLEESAVLTSLTVIGGLVISVTFEYGLRDPGILILAPFISLFTVFSKLKGVVLLAIGLIGWVVGLYVLELYGFYIANAVPYNPLEWAILTLIMLFLSMVIFRMTYYRMVSINLDLKALKDKAEEANKAKSSFLMTMSHELRTPLNAVIGYSESIIEEVEEDGHFADEHLEDINRIKKSGEDLLTVINDILDLSKIEANQLQVIVTEFSAAELVGDAVSTVLPMAKRNQNVVEIKNQALLEDLTIESDQVRLGQIIVNLLSNAVKYCRDGKVTIALNLIEFEDSENILIEVRDTGIGIPHEQIDSIFEPFQQVENSYSRSFAGTGLGLTISRKLADLLGGELSVKSEIGVGSSFFLIIPKVFRYGPATDAYENNGEK